MKCICHFYFTSVRKTWLYMNKVFGYSDTVDTDVGDVRLWWRWWRWGWQISFGFASCLGQSSQSEALVSQSHKPLDVCWSATLENIQTLHRHIKICFLHRRLDWLAFVKTDLHKLDVAVVESVDEKEQFEGKCISSRRGKNQRWKIISYFPTEALICAVLGCSDFRSDVRKMIQFLEWVRRWLVGTSTARLNSVCSSIYSLQQYSVLEWWLYFINKKMLQ